jgi:hypothetical protein
MALIVLIDHVQTHHYLPLASTDLPVSSPHNHHPLKTKEKGVLQGIGKQLVHPRDFS